jgi:uncharacterized membrane protein YgaE (UPF0421/DUF939 family)
MRTIVLVLRPGSQSIFFGKKMNSTQSGKPEFSSNFRYLIKCLISVIICYALYELMPQYPLQWAIITVVSVLSPDNNNILAYNMLKANMLGCSIGICLYPLHLTDVWKLCIGVIVTVSLGILLRLSSALRTALVALVIVTIYGEKTKHWYLALERVGCVMVGCLVAVMVTLLFNLVFQKFSPRRNSKV